MEADPGRARPSDVERMAWDLCWASAGHEKLRTAIARSRGKGDISAEEESALLVAERARYLGIARDLVERIVRTLDALEGLAESAVGTFPLHGVAGGVVLREVES